MRKNIVTYDQAKKLKELNFKELCLYNYDVSGNLVPNSLKGDGEEGITIEDLLDSNNSKLNEQRIDAPTIEQVQNWLLEKYKIYVEVNSNNSVKDSEHNWKYIIHKFKKRRCKSSALANYNSPSDALKAGILECLKLLG